MNEFSQTLPLTKRQTDKRIINYITHKMGKTLSSMSLLKIVGEKLPPSQRSRLSSRYTEVKKNAI